MNESQDPNRETSGSASSPGAAEESGFASLLSRYSKKASELSTTLVARAKAESSIAKLRAEQLAVSRQRKQHLRQLGELLLDKRMQPEVEALRLAVPALASELDAVAALEARSAAHDAEIETLRAEAEKAS